MSLNNPMKRFLTYAVILLTMPPLALWAADKISDLPASTSPSTNTWIELADMNQLVKSRKYLLTNLVPYGNITGAVTRAVVTNALATPGDSSLLLLGNGNWGIASFSNTTNSLAAPGIDTVWLNGKGLWSALALTNYFLSTTDANLTLTTNASGTNVTWTLALSDPLSLDEIIAGTFSLSNMTASVVPVFDANTNMTYSSMSTNTLNNYNSWATVLGHYAGTDTNALLSAMGGAPLSSPTFTGTATAPTAAIATATIGSGTVTNNIGVWFAAGNTNIIDMTIACETNTISQAITFLHATNGVAGKQLVHDRWFYANTADQTLTINSSWKTNVNSAVPAKLTNGTITRMILTSMGSTDSQTNIHCSFEFYK